MTSFTSNYDTIKKTLSKDQSLDLTPISGNMTTPTQGNIQSTFLQSVRSNKWSLLPWGTPWLVLTVVLLLWMYGDQVM
eukprot:CAMPEP_0171001406 /NCGR_PEP_ID=MMETSP0736-20130129/15466_1 /TAXON_ID=186038 /ORGANISM="Fragilariopsis kerguelensis, Strain L26-C5" /LENGTH=77 /DNA_ID=CAMNT_0011429341 /DNA_START=150 /DNA_END=383 /DNA_ORIENTATION=+